MNGNMDQSQVMGKSLFQLTKKYHNESISACRTPFYLNASTVPMCDHFLCELGLCITILKAQGQNIHKLFASLSEHPCAFLRC